MCRKGYHCVKMDIDGYRFHQYHIEIVEVCAEERYEVIPLQDYSPARNFFFRYTATSHC